MHGAVEGGADHLLAERGQRHGGGAGHRPVVGRQGQQRQVGERGGHDAGQTHEAPRRDADHRRAPAAPDRLAIDVGVVQVPGHRVVPHPRQSLPERRPLHHEDRRLSGEGESLDQVLEQVDRADQRVPHVTAPRQVRRLLIVDPVGDDSKRFLGRSGRAEPERVPATLGPS